MSVVGQRGFWDEQLRIAKLKEKKPVIQLLDESIPWSHSAHFSPRAIRKSARAMQVANV